MVPRTQPEGEPTRGKQLEITDIMTKKALITGITGQDGAYLAELLLEKGYEVHGIKRRSSLFNTDRIDHLYQDPHEPNQRFVLHHGDLTDSSSLIRIIQQVQPDEIYNLAAQSHVAVSFEEPEYTANSDALGTLAAARGHPHPRAGEEDPLLPGIHLRAVRQGAGDAAEGDHAVLPALALRRRQALRLLDHGQLPRGLRHLRLQRHPVQPREPDPRRDLRHPQDHPRHRPHQARPAGQLYLGNLDAKRDWGHAKDYVDDAVADAAAGQPEDFVIATGVQYSVRDFVDAAAKAVDISIRWEGSGVDEKGYDIATGNCIVSVDPRYFRPTEVETLLGDPTKAREKLGWEVMLYMRFSRDGGRAVIWLFRWLIFLMVLVALSRPSPGLTAAAGDRGDQPVEPQAPIQTIEGRIANSGLQLYRLMGLKKGQTLYVYASTTAGYLDPLAFVLKPEADAAELDREPLEALVETLARDHDPIEVTRQLLDRYALAGADDFEGRYAAAFSLDVPADGDYRLAIGSSLVRPSAGKYRLVIGVDEPDVLSGRPESRGPAFVFREGDVGVLEPAIVSVTGALEPDQPIRFYHLANMARGQTFYAFAEALTGDLRPVLTLYDQSDKPVAYANFAATGLSAALQYELPKEADRYRLGVTGTDASGAPAAGDFRLLLGVNAPEVLQGEGESTGRALLEQPIPVSIGVRLEQITDVDQKAENFGIVATLVMHWTSPRCPLIPRRHRTGSRCSPAMPSAPR
jgi:GDPmannose 4,6-dehydratase